MQLEIAFAKEPDEARSIVIYVRNIKVYISVNYLIIQQKYMDACASAFGFFLIGFNSIARYRSYHCIHDTFPDIYDPVLWFFKVHNNYLYICIVFVCL